MTGATIKRMLTNLGLMLLLVFPIWFGSLWLFARVNDGPQGETSGPLPPCSTSWCLPRTYSPVG